MPDTALADPFTVTPIGNGFGAEITGIDLARASDEELATLARIYRNGSVMAIRGQRLSPDELVRFCQTLGTMENHTREQFTLPGYPTIYVLSNKEVDGKKIGVHRDGLGWHSDGTYLAEPLDTTVLYALEAPPEGGNTMLADMHSAYEALDDAEKAELDQIQSLHSFVFLISQLDPQAQSVVTEDQKQRAPDVVHPLVLERENGARSLYLSSGSIREFVGQDPEASRQRVRDLIAHSTQEAFVYNHKWEVGDILLWDNRYSLHRATEYDDTAYTRLVYRLWVNGETGLVA